MGKILESFGVIDGYDLSEYGKISINKDGIFDVLEMKDSKIKEEAREIINEKKGTVFGISKKDILYGIYLFKSEKKNKKKVLTLKKKVFADELEKETLKKYDDYLINVLKDSLISSGYSQIILDEQIIQIDPSISTMTLIISSIVAFSIGAIIVWSITKDLIATILTGIVMIPVFSGFEVVVTKKRKRKKTTKK